MLDYEKLFEIAKECGFNSYGKLDVSTMRFLPEVRDMCAANTCGMYGKSWACPPGCGSLEEMRDKVKKYSAGILVQTIRDDVDFYEDWEILAEIRTLHNDHLDQLAAEMREQFEGVLEFSTGGCDVCEACSYPDAPCKKPVEQRLSLSAHGVSVGTTCKKAGLDYSFQNGRIRYVGMILHD